MSSIILRCGPSGWEYPHWAAAVYPRPTPRGFHALSFLAERFDTVEIAATFHGCVKPEIAHLWLRKVQANPAFQFTAKLWRRFTHDRILEPKEAEQFVQGLQPLRAAGRMGALLMQFPWSFRFTAENREYLIRLRRVFHQFPLVAEMRHDSWISEDALGTFIDYHISFCNIDQPAFARATPPTSYLTTGVGYVRLHGRTLAPATRTDGPPERTARTDYLYSPEELVEWSERVRHIMAHAESVFVITTNDAGGRSVVNALQLRSLLEELTGQESAADGLSSEEGSPEARQGESAASSLFSARRAVA